MNLLNVNKLEKTFNGEVLFSNVSFSVNLGEKVAIIGRNGTGKTTLLKMILGKEEFDAGSISFSEKCKVGYLSQDVIDDESNTVEEEINIIFKDLIRLENEIEKTALLLNENPNDQKVLNRYDRLEHEYSSNGGYDYKYETKMILYKFGLDDSYLNRIISSLSGGERTRVAFAKLLLSKPNLLILDEPTNHLDIKIIEWLESYLKSYFGAVLIVTHDKYFINHVVEKIIEIDLHQSFIYHTNYDNYVLEKEKRYEDLLKSYNLQQKEIKHLESFVERFRYKATKAKSAQDRIKKLDIIERIEAPTKSKKSSIKDKFETSRPTKSIILEAKNLTIGYDKPLISNLNFYMRGFDKIAIIGENGVGKSTLIKTLLGEILPYSGTYEFKEKFRIGYFDQNLKLLDYGKTLLDSLHDRYPALSLFEVRSKLARFMFTGDDVYKNIDTLSGGEKVRYLLLLLMMEKPNLLILDEPTNHLDIETKDIFEDIFSEYDSPIIFISHDRFLVNKIATEVLYLEKNNYYFCEGNYSDFLDKYMPREEEKQTKKIIDKKINCSKEIKKIEEEIQKLEKNILENKNSLFKEDIYNDKIKYYEVEDKISKDEKSLLELMEKLEKYKEDL